MMKAEELIAFEQDIAECFNRGEIRAPVHLDGGNEEQLIDIFQDIRPEDWVCGSWRMHYKCLLKGVPPAQLKADILTGKSISLCYPEYRIISSAIVGGILPIALGLAWSIKRSGGEEKVWCFLGDMTATTGMFHECVQYGVGQEVITYKDRILTYIIENNKKSVCTPTEDSWGTLFASDEWRASAYYGYDLKWPHAGAGVRVQF